MRASVIVQTLTLGFGCLAFAWGVFCIYGAAFPGPCGDNPGPTLGVIEAFGLDVPAALTLAIVAFVVRTGHPRLRTSCLLFSPVILSLPFVASFFLSRWHCG